MNQKKIRQSLITELALLTGRAARIDAHWRGEAPPSDWEELAVFRENDEVIASLDQRAHIQIAEIKQALIRMDQGEWETCINCGENIQEARLATLPTTSLCVRCAETNEQG